MASHLLKAEIKDFRSAYYKITKHVVCGDQVNYNRGTIQNDKCQSVGKVMSRLMTKRHTSFLSSAGTIIPARMLIIATCDISCRHD